MSARMHRPRMECGFDRLPGGQEPPRQIVRADCGSRSARSTLRLFRSSWGKYGRRRLLCITQRIELLCSVVMCRSIVLYRSIVTVRCQVVNLVKTGTQEVAVATGFPFSLE